MTGFIRFTLRGDFRDRLRKTLPGVTDADMFAFEDLFARDRVVLGNEVPHPDFVAWVRTILGRGDGAADAMAVVPVRPSPAPAAALIGGDL